MEAQSTNISNIRNEEDTFMREDSDGEGASFGLALESSGLPGGYHTSNDPGNRFQRATVTARQGAVDIHCKSQVVIHGKLDPGTDDFGTLLVYDLYFDHTKRFRRLKSVKVDFEFSGSESRFRGPEVCGLAPEKSWSLLDTVQQEHIERITEVALSGGPSGASLGGTQKWSRAIDRTTTDFAMLRGASICDEFGKERGVRWVMHENGTAVPKKGVPTFLRTAILLQRKTNDYFECAVNIEIEADWKTRMGRFFASKSQEKDDPIFFDPALPPVNKLEGFEDKFDVANLGAVNLEEMFDVASYRAFGNSIQK